MLYYASNNAVMTVMSVHIKGNTYGYCLIALTNDVHLPDVAPSNIQKRVHRVEH